MKGVSFPISFLGFLELEKKAGVKERNAILGGYNGFNQPELSISCSLFVHLVPYYIKSAQDISLRLPTLPPPRPHSAYPLHISSPLVLPQLSSLLTLLNQSLDIIDISTWTGDPHNASFISGQLRLLADTIDEAKLVLKGGEEVVGGRWWEDDGAGDETVSVPPKLLLTWLQPFLFCGEKGCCSLKTNARAELRSNTSPRPLPPSFHRFYLPLAHCPHAPTFPATFAFRFLDRSLLASAAGFGGGWAGTT